jgi:hypothetical protein
VSSPCSLMQRRGMGMATDRVLAIGVLSSIEQQTNNFDVPELGCQRERLNGADDHLHLEATAVHGVSAPKLQRWAD